MSDVTAFTVYSTRGALSSAAADSGITTGDILKRRAESVFRKFYFVVVLIWSCCAIQNDQ